MKDIVIFDLDGTLLDTSEGIFGSVRYAEQQMGLTPLPEETLREFVGPPPKSMYKKLHGLSEEEAMIATRYHREYGRTKAIYEAKVYPQMEEVLRFLKEQGVILAVGTLKQDAIAKTILEYFGLSQYFDYIMGMDPEETLSKSDILKNILSHVNAGTKAILVGDTDYDYEGAMEAQIDFLGVTYGYGFVSGGVYKFHMVEAPIEIVQYVLEE